MASVYKRLYQVYQDGKPVLDKNGQKLTRLSRTYSIKYVHPSDGKPRVVKGYTDKAASEQLAARLEKSAARGEEGMIDPFKGQKAKTLSAHIDDYLGNLVALGRDDMYIYNAKMRLAILCRECVWMNQVDITPESFTRWRSKATTRPGENGEPLAARTLNQYLEAARACCNWMVDQGRMGANPLVKVDKVQGDTKRKRRALAEPQIAELLAKSPAEHARVYRFILRTGLRRQEAADLQWGDLRINSPTPHIVLRAPTTKSRRADTIPLRSDLAAELKAERPADVAETDRVFPAVPDIELYKADLAAAGIEYMVDGRQADFHALRKTFCTLLSKAGVAPRMAQELMRHTDIRLTMQDYTDPRIFDTAAAVEKLAALAPATPNPAPAKAAGQEGA